LTSGPYVLLELATAVPTSELTPKLNLAEPNLRRQRLVDVLAEVQEVHKTLELLCEASGRSGFALKALSASRKQTQRPETSGEERKGCWQEAFPKYCQSSR